MADISNIKCCGWQGAHFGEQPPHFDEETMTRLVYKKEKCPDTGREHWQWFCLFKNPVKSFKAASLLKLGQGGKAIAVRGENWAIAINYVMKTDTAIGPVVNHGVAAPTYGGNRGAVWHMQDDGTYAAKQGEVKSGDKLRQALDMIMEGKTCVDVMNWDPVWYANNQKKVKDFYQTFNMEQEGKPEEVKVICLWGPTGTGKSHYAATRFPRAYWVTSARGGLLWFCGYNNQKQIVLDDFDGKISAEDFLKVTDKYQYLHRWQVKNGMTRLRHNVVVFTSNSHPKTWYPNESQFRQEAIMRRFDEIIYMSDKYTGEKKEEPKVKPEIKPEPKLERLPNVAVEEDSDSDLEVTAVINCSRFTTPPPMKRRNAIAPIAPMAPKRPREEDDEEEEDAFLEEWKKQVDNLRSKRAEMLRRRLNGEEKEEDQEIPPLVDVPWVEVPSYQPTMSECESIDLTLSSDEDEDDESEC